MHCEQVPETPTSMGRAGGGQCGRGRVAFGEEGVGGRGERAAWGRGQRQPGLPGVEATVAASSSCRAGKSTPEVLTRIGGQGAVKAVGWCPPPEWV